MKYLDSIPDLVTELDRFKATRAPTLPEFFRDKLYGFAFGSPVDTIVNSAELLYAARDELEPDGLTLVGQLFYAVSFNAWHGVNADERAPRIIRAMRRELGETPPIGEFAPREEDPAPKPEFVPPVETVADA
jgi:hypothetical protein